MNAVIAQCGGPTAVINTSLVAVIEQWRQLPGGGRVFGARFGLQGLVTGDWVDLTQLPRALLAASPVDRSLAALAGKAAVEAAQAGQSSIMVGLRAGADGWRAQSTPLGDVIGRERVLPAGFVDAAAHDVTLACIDFIRAVTGPLPPAPILWTEGGNHEHDEAAG